MITIRIGRARERDVKLPGSRMGNEELRRCMGVDEQHAVLRGVRELVERMQMVALQTAGDEAEPDAIRLAAVVRYDTGRMLMESMEKWRKVEKREEAAD